MYLETMEKVLADIDKVIIEKNAGSGVVPYLPLPELQKESTIKNECWKNNSRNNCCISRNSLFNIYCKEVNQAIVLQFGDPKE